MSTIPKIRIGVAGAGKMGKNHIRVLSELGNMFELVGVYDPIPERRNSAAKTYDIEAFCSYEQLLDSVEAVTIACPTSLHKELATLAGEKGVHTLVEKPASECVSDTEDMCILFAKKGLRFTVGHVERFNPVIRCLSDIAKNVEIAAIEVHRCGPFDSRIYDVDVVSDLMIHDIDIVSNAICDSDVFDVNAFGKRVYGEKFVDYATAALTFPNGVLAFITASRCTEDKIRKICLHTKGSFIEGDLLNRTLVIKRSANFDERGIVPHSLYSQSNITEHIVLPNEEPLKQEMINFGRSIFSDITPEVSSKQVLRSMKILERIEDAIYSGGGKF